MSAAKAAAGCSSSEDAAAMQQCIEATAMQYFIVRHITLQQRCHSSGDATTEHLQQPHQAATAVTSAAIREVFFELT